MQSYAAARTALEAGTTTCERLVTHFLTVIAAKNPALNIFNSVATDLALDRARTLDAEWAMGQWRPLTGLVLGVKDVIAIQDQPLTCSSRILENFTSLFSATAIQRLEDAGAIFIGKLNCDEFAMGSSNENSAFGPVRNPRNPDYVPGGSSGGSAGAVAAGMCHASLGTDTGGSVRLPAAFCGVSALKPTYGRISRLGLVAFASSFDCIGPIAHTTADLAAMLHVMAGVDPWDSTSAPHPVPDYSAALEAPMAGLRVGLPKEFFGEGLDPAVRAQLDVQKAKLEAAGAVCTEVTLPHTEYGIAAYYILTMAEASSNLARYDGVRYGYRAEVPTQATAAGSRLDHLYTKTRTEGFGPEVKRRIMLGTYVLSSGYYDAYYTKAQQVRTLIRQDFERVFDNVDVLLTPAAPSTAFPLGAKSDPLTMYLTDIYTVTPSLAGIPGLVIPMGTHPNGLPMGAQLLAPHFEEATLLQVGHVLEAVRG